MAKTTNQYRGMVQSNYSVGDNLSASMRIRKMGTKYVTCTSIMGCVHDVRYTYIDFAFNFMNKVPKGRIE